MCENPVLVCSQCGTKVTIRVNKRRIIILCEQCEFTHINYRHKVIEESNLPKFIKDNY